ncbi:23S rRNA (uracil(1939)-C(5))-methyltransferase RlmD [Robiginitalea sp. M366]|uniref:23S rRNA (uracil(1939)-C(5))-methyltransferase RlmD n=1 Tax=Robiginitalea aestuariiviva TaxID=3036903 RepID=UPI00240D9E3A|nr:23S rRNA (uracil(1939)-C(5))-methyltransferase RlmD [Robiginitalea aestuariiviva]MDG1573164.1 23S rRNA (uracil(1939)-C(5))-methyltransferase RlmD [Robiginitalea aestuariiviva]
MRKRKNLPEFGKLQVTGAGSRGKSIAKAPDGRVVLLQGAVPGDTVRAQVYKKRKGFYEARVLEVLEPSPHRIAPRCRHFGTCGGCKWQHMAYQEQLRHKAEEVENNLRRIGKVDLPDILPILPAPETFHYRNKMEFSFSCNRWLEPWVVEQGKPLEHRNGLGLHIPGMWDKILDLEECYLQAAPSDHIRLAIRNFALEHGYSFFDPRSQQGLLRTLMIRNTDAGDFMVLIQFGEDDPQRRNPLLDYLVAAFPEIKSLYYVVNQKGNDTLYDLELTCYHGEPHITEVMEDLRFRITPKSFYQTNSRQALELYRVVRRMAGLSGEEWVYDLYTGLGTIAQFVARQARGIVGIEAVPEAIEAARINAKENGIENISFFAGDMKSLFTDAFVAEHGKPDVVITDPPRDGMHKDVVAQLLKLSPSRIVYVSCNSATQARDLALMDETYRVVEVQPVDMFPHTHHVENVVLLQRKAP